MTAEITIEDYEHDPEEPAVGEQVEFRVKVKNKGTSADDSIGVVIYDENDDPVFVPPNFRLNPGEETWTIWTGYSSFDAGTHDLRIEVTDYDEEETFTLTVGDDAGWITGDVDTDSNADVGMRVSISGNGVTRTKPVDSDASFRFDSLPPGEYTIEVYGSEIDGDEETVTVYGDSESTVSLSVTVETYELTIDSEPIHVDIDGEGEYDHLADVSVEAPRGEDGYEFSHWESPSGEEIWSDNVFDLTMYSDRTIIAQYIDPGNPDLTVSSIDTESSSPTEDETIEFEIDVENTGDADAEDVELRVSPENGPEYTEYGIDVDAGDTETIHGIGDWESPDPGYQWVTAEINPDRSIDEESYDNNEERDTVEIEDIQTRPDFTVEDIDTSPASPTAGDSVDIDVTLKNTGEEDASSIPVDVTVAGDDEQHLVDLPGGGDDDVTVWDVSKPAGTYDVTVTINPDEEFEEQSYDNNTADTTITFSEPDPVIDGRVSFVETPTGEVTRGDSVTTRVEVTNTGNTDHEFFVGFTVIGPGGDRFTNNDSTGHRVALGAGESDTTTLSWNPSTTVPSGEYDVVTVLWRESDRDALATDLGRDEQRGVFTIPQREYPAQASVTSVSASPDAVSPGGEVTIEGRVENESDVAKEFRVVTRSRSSDTGETDRVNTDTITVETGDAARVTSVWSVHESASGSYSVSMTVLTSESTPDELDSETVTNAVTVRRESDPEVSVSVDDVSSIRVVPPADVTVTSRVENTGVSDVLLHGVALLEIGENMSVVGDVERFTVGAGERVTESFTVSMPSDTPVGEHTPRVYVATSAGEMEPGDIVRGDLAVGTADTDVRVLNPAGELTASALDVSPSEPVVGDSFSVQCDARNTALHRASDVTAAVVVNDSVIEEKSVAVSGESTATISFDGVEVSEPGEHTIGIRFSESSADGDVVTAVSDDVVVTREQLPENDISIQAINVTLGDPVVGDEVTIEPELRNAGDTPYDVSVDMTVLSTGDSTRETPQVSVATVEADVTRTFTATVSVTDEFETGPYNVEVTVNVDDEPVATKTRRDAFTVSNHSSGVTALTTKAFTPTYDSVSNTTLTLRGVDVSYDDTHDVPPDGVTISSLPKGTYEYTAESDAVNQTLSGEITLRRDEERRAIKFNDTEPVSGVVMSNYNGKPVPNADVTINSDRFTQTTVTDELGRFEMPGEIPALTDAEFTVEVNPTTELDKDIMLKSSLALYADGNGTIGGEINDEIDTDETFEQFRLQNTNPVVELIITNPKFKQYLLQSAVTPYAFYGAVKGFVHVVVNTFTGLFDSLKALIGVLLNLPGVIGRIIDLIEFAIFNHEEVFKYINNVLHSLELPDIDKHQREDNPYDEDGGGLEEFKFTAFKAGWYIGYVVTTIAFGAGTLRVASRGKAIFKSIEKFEEGISRVEKAVESGKDIIPKANRLKSIRAKETRFSNAVQGSTSMQILIDAPQSARDALEDTVTGAYAVNIYTVSAQSARTSFLEKARELPSGSLKPSLMREFDKVYEKTPGSINSGDIGNAFGGAGEYTTIAKMIRMKNGEFSDITENDIYGSLFVPAMTRGDDAIIASVDLGDVDFEDYVRDGYSLDNIKDEIGIDSDLDGELDFVRVSTPSETNGRPVVTRVYERKSGSSIDAGNTEQKLSHIGKIRALADHPGIDSQKVVNEWGMSLRSFTRARDRSDVSTPNGDDLDFKFITARDTTDNGAVSGPFSPEFGDDVPVSTDIIKGDHSKQELKEVTRYLTKGRAGETTEKVTERKSSIDFLFTNPGGVQ